MSDSMTTVRLTVAADPHLARLVRMTAANVAMLSSMSVERVEDMRMAAEEAFVFSCGLCPGTDVAIRFDVDATRVGMVFELGEASFEDAAGSESAVYADLILGAVCDEYEKRTAPTALVMTLKADV